MRAQPPPQRHSQKHRTEGPARRSEPWSWGQSGWRKLSFIVPDTHLEHLWLYRLIGCSNWLWSFIILMFWVTVCLYRLILMILPSRILVQWTSVRLYWLCFSPRVWQPIPEWSLYFRSSRGRRAKEQSWTFKWTNPSLGNSGLLKHQWSSSSRSSSLLVDFPVIHRKGPTKN